MVALRSDLLATENSAKAERDRFLEELNRLKLEIEQLKKSRMGKDAALKVLSTCLVDTEKTSTWRQNRKRATGKF